MSLHQFKSWPCWKLDTPRRRETIEVTGSHMVMPEQNDPFGARLYTGWGNGDGWRVNGTGVRWGCGWIIDDDKRIAGDGYSKSMD